jgi:RNase H-fold protein (predicted Holliday junction resolvase)
MNEKNNINKKMVTEKSPKILSLDVSTKTIGIALFDIESKELLELTHVSPVPKPKRDNKMEELLIKAEMVRSKIENYKNLNVTEVVIEEPLLGSNNIYTIQTLLRFNTLVFKDIYDVLGIVPEFISTYNARKFAFPHLVQPNDKGKHVLFGGFPRDIDKKLVLWELVAKKEPQISWLYTKNNTLKKENFDMSDAYVAGLGCMRLKQIW